METEAGRTGASFNMAIATLARLDGILRRMEMVSELTSGTNEQRRQIKLLRHFFINATPLMVQVLKKESYNNFKKKVLQLQIPTKLIKGRRVEYYNPELSDEILNIVSDIQIEIKEHFMPRKEEDEDDY